MKIFKYLLFVIPLALCAFLMPVQEETKQEQQEEPSSEKDLFRLKALVRLLETQHYAPQEIDDAFSEKVFEIYLGRMDYNKRFLVQDDIKRLSKYKLKIDDQIDQGKFDFFDLSFEILSARVLEAQGYYREFLAQPFDFDVDEEVELDPEKLEYARSKKDLKAYWRKVVKYQTLHKLVSKLDKQEKAIEKGDSIEIKTFEQLELEAREKVLKEHDQWFKRINKLRRSDRLTNFFNSVTMVFDPHSNFYPPKDKENFDISLSGRLEGIGATLQEEDGYIKVTRIVTGSASWKQGELEAGDLILKVGQATDEAVSIVDMRLDEAVKLIRGKKGTEVQLTVRKMDGEEIIIPIIRDVVILEETYAKSAIIENGSTDMKVGYINLPKFYADFNRTGGRSCAADVKIEVEKLKTENVEGIVIDLRNNGGGSLRDVVDMAGLFIEKGPIVQVKPRGQRPYILSDPDPFVQYDGPLVIMVNSLSASASEILAAAMQDYGRAVVIGSASTYGKGTVQRFEDLDVLLPEENKGLSPIGSIKFTIQKFYRINGGATQRKGVEPDIVLPDNYKYIDFGEKEVDHAMAWDEIDPVQYTTYGLNQDRISQVISESEKRIGKDSTFVLLDMKAKRYNRLREDNEFSLNLDTFRAEKKKEKAEGKKFEGLAKKIDDLEISNPTIDRLALEKDTASTARNEEYLKKLRKDIYLYEATNIVGDLAEWYK